MLLNISQYQNESRNCLETIIDLSIKDHSISFIVPVYPRGNGFERIRGVGGSEINPFPRGYKKGNSPK